MQLFPSNATLDDKVQIAIIYVLRFSAFLALAYSMIVLNYYHIANGLVALILLFIPEFIERKYKVKLPVEYSFAIVAFVFGSIVLGELRGFYTKYSWWDDLLHSTSGVLLGFAGFITLYWLKSNKKLHASDFVISFFAFTVAMTIAVFWEIFEFVADQSIATNLQLGSLNDTMLDLIIASIGAAFSAALGYRFLSQANRKGLFARLVYNFTEVNEKKRRHN
ncbi:hypothetical protein KBB17_00045 [Candidatus Saccharibacteria bacterium]|jgi:hypothetical protein|nr:hypothetical protein [Candidatus Saccharibacteria bacterium]